MTNLIKETLITSLEHHGFVFFIDKNVEVVIFNKNMYLENPRKYVGKLTDMEFQNMVTFLYDYGMRNGCNSDSLYTLLKESVNKFYEYNWYKEEMPKEMIKLLKKSNEFRDWFDNKKDKQYKKNDDVINEMSDEYILDGIYQWPQDAQKKMSKKESTEGSKEQKQPNKNTSYEFNEIFSIKKSHKKKKENCEDTLSEIEEKLLIELGKYPREKYIKYKKEIMMIMRVEVVPEMKERCPLIIWDHVIFLKCQNDVSTFLNTLYAHTFMLLKKDENDIFLLYLASMRTRTLYKAGRMLMTLFDPECVLDHFPITTRNIMCSRIRRIKLYFDVSMVNTMRKGTDLHASTTFQKHEQSLLNLKEIITLTKDEKQMLGFPIDMEVDQFILIEMAWASLLCEIDENRNRGTLICLEMILKNKNKQK